MRIHGADEDFKDAAVRIRAALEQAWDEAEVDAAPERDRFELVDGEVSASSTTARA